MEEDLSGRVGARVRRLRTERGWTLDGAAGRLGVSRRLLVQLEAGQANPSLSTLLAVAEGFGVPLVELLAERTAPMIAVQPDNRNAAVLWRGPAGGQGRLLVAADGLELWQWVLQPGEERRSDAHRRGAREALTVTDGTLTIDVGGEQAVLRRGQSAAFPADVAHRYANDAARPVRFTLAVHEAG
ncbi:MAG: helix-turn-helix domain-containing protein [Acidimicrobiia bacterium]